MAPEIVNGKPYDQKVDIWSAGIVVYVMLCGKSPFTGQSKEEVFEAIKK